MDTKMIFELIQKLKSGELLLEDIKEIVCPATYNKLEFATTFSSETFIMGDW